MLEQRIGFVGTGQMARALARGFVQSQLLSGDQLVAHDPFASATDEFQRQHQDASIVANNGEVVANADIIIIAVKPQSMPQVLAEIKDHISANSLIISIAAGVKLKTLCSRLASERIVRVMPNTPCLVGQGAAGFSLAAGATTDDSRVVSQLLSSVGLAFELKESLLDAVTGLSGSGPAYIYTVIEALSDGGVQAGLPRNVATQLAAQTVRGAAEMVLQSDDHPGQLKDRVTSPGGTTIAGLAVLEARAVRSAFIDAVQNATTRAAELGLD